MSPNKKPVFIVAIALCALIFIPLLLWLGSLPFRSKEVGNGSVQTLSPGNGPSGNTADFALRKLADRAQSLVEGPLAEAAQSGDIPLESVLSIRKTKEKAASAMVSGNAKKAAALFQSVVENSEAILAALEQADRARELMDATYQRLGKMQPLKNAFPTSYAEAVSAFDFGQSQLANNLYQESVDSFTQVGELLDELEAGSVEQIKIGLEGAKRAIDQYDLKTARSRYESVLQLSPAQPEALSGLNVIESMEGIASEVQELDTLEEAGQLEEANQLIAELLRSRAGNPYLLSRQQTIQNKIRDRDFFALVDQANQFEASGNLSDAVIALEAALNIQSSQAIEKRLKDLKDQIKAKRLEVLLDEGYNALNAGRYEAARNAYKAALDLEPKSDEARTGYEKAAGLLLASIRYNQNMENAEKYIKEGRYPLAAKFFNKAMTARPAQLTLAQKSEESKIRQTIERESKQIDVRIVSNGKTYVSMTGVFPPEKTYSKELSLFPDVYKLKGTRKGYRTVEKSIQINSSLAGTEITLQCTERE